MLHEGIILKINSYDQSRCIVLDQELGKINGYLSLCRQPQLCHGMIIRYANKEYKNGRHLYDIEILETSHVLAKKNIIFLHHLLEFCLFFVPQGLPTHVLISFFKEIYLHHDHLNQPLIQKILICKLLNLLGIFPEHEAIQIPKILFFLSMPVDRLVDQEIDLKIEQQLDTWIFYGVQMHPTPQCFKTMRFLTQLHLGK